MQHPNGATPSNISSTADLDPVVVALRENHTFDRAQVAWLMALGYRWGYEARVDEENSAWPESTAFCAGDVVRGINQRAYRHQCDQAAGLPRPGDHRGGPVPVWGDEAWVAA